jgi:hypothetical protein
MTTYSGSSFRQLPATSPGWWAVGLAAVYLVMLLINSAVLMRISEDMPWRTTVLPFYGIFMILSGLAAGVIGLIALLRNHERSWLVWMAIVPGLSAFVFILGEFLMPH